ncbi:MAG: hypothetical protein ACJ76N_02165 [Thermoanaerobaculia bacterium]
MTDEPIDPELDELFGLLADEERGEPGPGEHPDDATLSAYHARTLLDGEVSRVQDHLVACRQCRDQLLEHARFMESPVEGPAEGVSSFEKAAEWRRLKERMEPAEARAPEPSPAVPMDDRRRMLRSLRVFKSLAAAFAALALGLFLRDVYVQKPARVLSERALSFGTTRSAPEPKKIQVRLPAALRIIPETEYPRYLVEIEPANGKRVQTLELPPAPDGWLIELVDPGTYEIRVLGLKDGRFELVGKPQGVLVVP